MTKTVTSMTRDLAIEGGRVVAAMAKTNTRSGKDVDDEIDKKVATRSHAISSLAEFFEIVILRWCRRRWWVAQMHGEGSAMRG